MNIVLLTSDRDALGGVFGSAYREGHGPELSGIVTLENGGQSAPLCDRFVMAMKLLKAGGTTRMGLARLGFPLAGDAQRGLHHRWPDVLATDKTCLLRCRRPRDTAWVEGLRQLEPSVLVSVGAPIIFGRNILELASIGAINIHNGLLPTYRGHFGTFWEVAHAESWGYVCAHEMIPRVDSGRILGWDRVAIAESASFFDLLVEKKRLGGRLLARLLRDVARTGSLPPSCPIHPSRELADAYFDFPTRQAIRRFCWPNGFA